MLRKACSMRANVGASWPRYRDGSPTITDVRAISDTARFSVSAISHRWCVETLKAIALRQSI